MLKTLTQLQWGKYNWNNQSQAIIDKYGDELYITTIIIYKIPLSFLLNYGYKFYTNSNDTAFHIGMVVKASNGQFLTIEKNQQPIIKMGAIFPQNCIKKECYLLNPILLNDMLNKTSESIGKKFWIYQALASNCQMFIMWFLKTCGIDSKENEEFIVQDFRDLRQRFPIERRILNTITDTQSKLDTFLGRGF